MKEIEKTFNRNKPKEIVIQIQIQKELEQKTLSKPKTEQTEQNKKKTGFTYGIWEQINNYIMMSNDYYDR